MHSLCMPCVACTLASLHLVCVVFGRAISHPCTFFAFYTCSIKNICYFCSSVWFLSLAAALDVFFIDDTPRVRGGESGTVYAEIATTKNNSEIRCRFQNLDGDNEDCKDFLFCLFPIAVNHNNHYKSYSRFRWYLQSY